MSREWTIQPVPLEGELFTSWICRLAREKCLNPNHLLEGFRMYNRDIDVRPYGWLINELLDRTNVSEQEINSMLLVEWDNLLHKFKRGGYPIGVVGRPHYKTQGIRACPRCLKEDSVPHYRRAWRIGLVTACLKHTCLLIDRCPECGEYIDPKRVKWNVAITSCHKCGFDLRNAHAYLLKKDDPFIGAVEELSSLEYADKHVKVFKIARLLWEVSSQEESYYKGHPLTKEPLVKNLFNGNRKNLFTHVESVYLVIGVAWALLKDEEQLDSFLRQNNSCIEHFWTDKPYCCHQDGHKQGFKTKFNRTRHSLGHNGIRPNVCPNCGDGFIQKVTLDKHMKKCGKEVFTFPYKRDLLVHLKTHNTEKEFFCPECKKGFDSKTYLKDHLNACTNKRPHKCPMCEHRSNFKRYLPDHMRSHTKEKHLVCLICGREFGWRSSYNRHKRRHSGEKPHKCQHCGRKFGHRASLNRHVKSRCPNRPMHS
ncbi:MAG: TniQ family protein [Candidatus Hydrothermarchaeales archaeon]